MKEALMVDDMFVDSTVVELKATNEQLYRVVEDLKAVIHQRDAALEEMIESHYEAMTLLVLASDFRSGRNGKRLLRVAVTAEILAGLAGMPPDYCAMIRRAAPLFDIGTTGLPDELLHKTGDLSDAEWAQWRSHTEIGARILSSTADTPLMKLAAEISLSHHENYQGHGYPSGLVAQAIPMSGRIVAVAEYLETCGDSGGKKPVEAQLDAVLSTIRNLSGRRFDPHLVELLIANMETISEAHDKINSTASSFQEIAATACLVRRGVNPVRGKLVQPDGAASRSDLQQQLYRYAEDFQELLDCRDSLSHVVQTMIPSKGTDMAEQFSWLDPLGVRR